MIADPSKFNSLPAIYAEPYDVSLQVNSLKYSKSTFPGQLELFSEAFYSYQRFKVIK